MELSTIHAYQQKYANVFAAVLQNPLESYLEKRNWGGKDWIKKPMQNTIIIIIYWVLCICVPY